MNPILKIQSLIKNYHKKIILNDINFDIFPGSIVSLLGANGAGKTTLINTILGLEKPSSGKIYLNGLCPSKSASRLNIGWVPQVSHFIDELTGRETIQFVGKHFAASKNINKLIHIFSLQDFVDKKIVFLSEGQKKRLALSLAFVGNPKIVFLDEPTAGLDIQSRLDLWQYLKCYRQFDTTIFLTTHYLEEAEALSDRVLILQNGTIQLDKSIHEINAIQRQSKIFFKLYQESNWITQDTVQSIDDETYLIQTDDSDGVIREMVNYAVPFYDLKIEKQGLTDIFVKLTQGGLA